jgi:hypothetical protein
MGRKVAFDLQGWRKRPVRSKPGKSRRSMGWAGRELENSYCRPLTRPRTRIGEFFRYCRVAGVLKNWRGAAVRGARTPTLAELRFVGWLARGVACGLTGSEGIAGVE